MKILIFAAAVLLSFPAAAATLFSTLGGPFQQTLALSNTDRVATDFITGAETSTVTGVTLRLNSDHFPHNQFIASIYTDSTGAPGTLVGTFDLGTIPDSNSTANYSTTGSVSLNASTTYWLAVSLVNAPPVSNGYTAWTASYSASLDNGDYFDAVAATPLNQSSGVYPNNTPPNVSPHFELTGTIDAAPEPSRAILVLLGSFALIARRRRC